MPQRLSLNSLCKEKVAISFDPENARADFYLRGGGPAFDLLLKSAWNRRHPHFMEGWQALLLKRQYIRTVLECTPPGIFEHAGEIYTRKELRHADQFVAGGFSFEYSNPGSKWLKGKSGGANILEGKV